MGYPVFYLDHRLYSRGFARNFESEVLRPAQALIPPAYLKSLFNLELFTDMSHLDAAVAFL
jgi:hypothetical protein